MKRVLVVYYSQSGQLERAARACAEPLRTAGHTVDFLRLEPLQPYPFPWPFWQFLDVFPESVALDPPPLKPWQAPGHELRRYDLILLCYTAWFLSPAPPVTAFLKSAEGRALLRNTPVVTLSASRNMWVLAQEEVKKLLLDAGARLSDHVALVDPGPSLATFITTPRWMLTGRRDAFLGLPPAGIPERELDACARFGRALAAPLAAGSLDGTRPMLTGLAAATVDPALLASEKIGRRSFRVWSKLLRAVGPPGHWGRRPVLAGYVVFLILMIVTVVPVSLLLRALLRPLLRARLEAQAARYEQPSGRGHERLAEFT
jgi:hypothetical protein